MEAGAPVNGADTLSRILCAYFEKMMTVIIRHGGDVLKFAGDAVLVLFPCRHDALRAAALRAAQCALALQHECGSHRATDKVSLSLHIGVGLGSLALFLVGGAYGIEIYAPSPYIFLYRALAARMMAARKAGYGRRRMIQLLPMQAGGSAWSRVMSSARWAAPRAAPSQGRSCCLPRRGKWCSSCTGWVEGSMCEVPPWWCPGGAQVVPALAVPQLTICPGLPELPLPAADSALLARCEPA